MRRLILFAAAALLCISLLGVLQAGGEPGANAESSDDRFEEVRVERRDIVRTATIRGRLEAADSLKFGPPPVQSQWQFKISFLAPEGEDVDKGAPLVGFDTTELARKLLEAQSALATAQTRFQRERSNAELSSERRDLETAEAQAEVEKLELKADVPADVAASRDLEQTHLELAQARAKASHLAAKAELESRRSRELIAHIQSQVEEKSATVAMLRSEIESMTIRAPSAGTVVYETNWRNEKKKVGDQMHRMESVLSLPDLTRLRATASVDEAYAALVKIGQPVSFVLDAFPEQQFQGAISDVNPAVKQRSWRDRRKVVFVGLELADPDIERMRPGMRFQGELEVERITDVVAIPVRCVERRPVDEGAVDRGVVGTGDHPTVRVDGLLGERHEPVVLGDFGEGWIAIEAGLSPGDTIRCRAETS